SESVTDITKKAAAYNIEAEAVDVMDVLAVAAAARRAAEMVRSGAGPRLLECRTYRFRAHSMFDPELYRNKNEVRQWQTHCPIATFIRQLKEKELLTDTALKAIEDRIDSEIQTAVDFAEAGTWESPTELTHFVYSDRGSE
ncbi:MAG: thiamine pyrophosphate-dependent enzyme, partial [Thermodesulfobacteriota bacterium]